MDTPQNDLSVSSDCAGEQVPETKKLDIIPGISFLATDINGQVALVLIQTSCGMDPVGTDAASFNAAESPFDAEKDKPWINECKCLLKQAGNALATPMFGWQDPSSTGASFNEKLVVLGYQIGLKYLRRGEDQTYPRDNDQTLVAESWDKTVVGLAGDCRSNHQDEKSSEGNITIVAACGIVTPLPKLSLATEDTQWKRKSGSEFTIFQGPEPMVNWAVLNSHDYTHVDLVKKLLSLEEHVELLVVVTFNHDWRLYWEYATADIHRLFCYVVIVNAAEIGGSGVFAPFAHIGEKKKSSLGTDGGRLFAARGAGAFQARLSLDIGELRRLRQKCKNTVYGPDEDELEDQSDYHPILPSQHFVQTPGLDAGPPKVVRPPLDVPFAGFGNGKFRVALAQLNFLPLCENGYRLRRDPKHEEFISLLKARLSELEARCRYLGKTDLGKHLDMLVLPELYLPRGETEWLQHWARSMGAIVIAGVDYPQSNPEVNANECMILLPDQKDPIYYRKITRSQYDGRKYDAQEKKPSKEFMAYERGDRLIRFVDSERHGFGVLICYDYSHFDLVHSQNLDDRSEPLDLLVVVANNPAGPLYQSCCIADSHRFYQYVAMCNVAKYGGSGVFAPKRLPGERQVMAEAGKGVEAVIVAELDIAGLRKARSTDDKVLQQGEKGKEGEKIGFKRRPGIFQWRAKWMDEQANEPPRGSDTTNLPE